jgi:hypothetical protein
MMEKLVTGQEGIHEDLDIYLEPHVAVMIDLISQTCYHYIWPALARTTQPPQTRLINSTAKDHNTKTLSPIDHRPNTKNQQQYHVRKRPPPLCSQGECSPKAYQSPSSYHWLRLRYIEEQGFKRKGKDRH